MPLLLFRDNVCQHIIDSYPAGTFNRTLYVFCKNTVEDCQEKSIDLPGISVQVQFF